MNTIRYEDLSHHANAEVCHALCDKLMAHQAQRGIIRPDILAGMCFENRLKPSFESNPNRFLMVSYDDETPIGYVFANAFLLTREALTVRPDWAAEFPAGSGELYPQDLPVPCTVADLNNLYVLPEYRGAQVGQQLINQAMAWMRTVKNVKYIFTHVSNGNNAGSFYEKQGFRFSHKVWGGFLEAYLIKI